MLQVSGRAVIKALEKAGWVQMKATGGSHVKLRRRDGTGRATVPDHGNRPLPPGTLKRVLGMAGMSEDELKELL